MLLPLAISLAACTSDLATLPAEPAQAGRASTVADSGARWSDAASWPERRVPSAGADVVIPEGQRIVLDVTPPELRSLVVRGTLALPASDTTPRALVAGHVEVRGRLEAGSELRPYRGRFTLTLTGRSDAQGLMHKALAVLPGAVLELHGPERLPWTRLASTAEPGATQLVVAERVDWRPGERIVVAPSGYEQDEAEVRTIARIDGRTLTLDAPLSFRHLGESLQIAGIDVEHRAEVGLLSRGIRIEGDVASDANGDGGHVIVFRDGTAHVDGIELHRMGQRGVLARYPMHWHMADHAPGQYFVRSSVWHSYSRCVTVHGTHDVTVADNVCYDHTGHGYFLEDGIETNNTITGNLGLFSRQGTILTSDATPSSFWITHPDNTVEHNVSAGSMGHGFWYAVEDHPTGPSATASVWPRFTPLRSFRDNLAHAVEGDALHVQGEVGSYSPRAGGVPTSTTPEVASFEGLTVYSSRRAYWSRGDHIRLQDPVFVDNYIGVQAGHAGGHAEGELVGGLVAGWSTPEGAGGEATRHGVVLYDGPVHMRGVTFANYDRPGSAAISGRESSDVVSGRFSVERSRFVDARPVLLAAGQQNDGMRMTRLLDIDGSASGIAGSAIVASDEFLVDEACEARADWNAYLCRGGFASIALEGSGGISPAAVDRDDGRRTRFDGYTPNYLQFPVRTSHAYAIRPDAGARDAFNLIAEGLAAGESVTISVPVTASPWRALTLDATRTAVPAVGSREALERTTATALHFDRDAGVVYIRFVGQAGRDRLGVYVYGD